MDTSTRLITATTALSLVVHGVVVAVILSVSGVSVSPADGVGPGINIHLISSDVVANNFEFESRSLTKEHFAQAVEKKNEMSQVVLIAKNNRHTVLPSDVHQKNVVDKPSAVEVIQSDSSIVEAQFNQSTHASKQQHSIVELLHSRISDKKAYPYLAKKQRREGVATVAFVLHPNGRIENAHLVNSSRTQSLDRAALSAVQDIEPFSVAQDYLKQSETFQVNVAFNLL